MKETFDSGDRAAVLARALPYIQKFQGKTVVVKYGGNAMINEDLKTAVMEDLVMMSCVGMRVVLVHGGGPEIDAMLKRVGKESRFVKGLRYTDEETMEIVQMVLCGKVNKDITGRIARAGGRALGLCGIDGALLKARKIRGEEDLGLVGEIEEVDVSPLNTILDSGAVPVVSSVAIGFGEDSGLILNVNADIAAARIAAAMKAEELLLMTDVRGLLRNLQDPDSLVGTATRAELEEMKKNGVVSKGMIPKTDCCRLALDGGVKKARILDGRLPHALLIELFTGEGIGTTIVP
ncbi:MAG: acetylglutamate kinase [Treponema sp.]|jgi:acetylglutamate kinase|nr:acetylglutamate kinase [Treponema sp.]